MPNTVDFFVSLCKVDQKRWCNDVREVRLTVPGSVNLHFGVELYQFGASESTFALLCGALPMLANRLPGLSWSPFVIFMYWKLGW